MKNARAWELRIQRSSKIKALKFQRFQGFFIVSKMGMITKKYRKKVILGDIRCDTRCDTFCYDFGSCDNIGIVNMSINVGGKFDIRMSH